MRAARDAGLIPIAGETGLGSHDRQPRRIEHAGLERRVVVGPEAALIVGALRRLGDRRRLRAEHRQSFEHDVHAVAIGLADASERLREPRILGVLQITERDQTDGRGWRTQHGIQRRSRNAQPRRGQLDLRARGGLHQLFDVGHAR